MDPAVLVPVDVEVVGLNVALVHRGRVELAFYYDVGIGEPLADVPQRVLEVLGHVAHSVGLGAELLGHEVFMEDRGVVLHRFRGRHYRGQDFVVDLDQGDGLLGHVDAGGRDAGDGVPLVDDLCFSHDLVAGVGPLTVRQVFGGHDRAHAVEGFGLAGVDGLDPGVRVGTPEHLAEEHARGVEVGAVLRGSGDLVRTIMPDGPGADDVVLFRGQDNVRLVSCRQVATSVHRVIGFWARAEPRRSSTRPPRREPRIC